MPLLQMINTTGKARCFSPVDKICGVLSVCQEFDRRMVKVDYHICIRCLLIWVAGTCYYDEERTVHYLCFKTHQANKMHSLPSWVPDYTTDDDEGHLVVPHLEGSIPFSTGASNAVWTGLGLSPIHSLELDGQAVGEDYLNSLQIRYEDPRTLETLLVPRSHGRYNQVRLSLPMG